MATKTETVVRDYQDNFSIKDFTQTNLVPKYFEDQDVSDLNVGLLGYTTELIGDGLEDVFNTTSLLYAEQFSNRAKIPSSILSHAAIFQLSNGMATAATCEFIFMIKEQYVLDNAVIENGQYVFYIDKDTKVLVEDKVFSLDYDIRISFIYRTAGYIYSAQYMMTEMNNSISNINTPYINIQKIGSSNVKIGSLQASENYLTMKVTCHQIQRIVKFEEIINNTKINFPSFDIDFDGQLAGFDIMYKPSDSSEYNVQLTKLNKYSAPIIDPFCYYSFTDEQTLTISFGNNNAYFQPDFNSELMVYLYITEGEKGNFDEYSGYDVSVVTTADRFSYNDNFFVMAKVMSASSNGKDTRTLEELQALTVEGYRTATAYSTENDIEEYFNNYPYRYGNDCRFIKKRDDVIDRLYSGFLVMKRDDYIYPTNTLYIDTNLGLLKNTSENRYVIDPGYLFTYTADGHIEFITEGNEILTVYDLNSDSGEIDPITGKIITKKEKLEEKYKFIYTNPFLLAISTRPNLAGHYLTIDDQTVAVDFVDQNLDVFDQFVCTTMNCTRVLSNDREYTISTSIFPSATIIEEVTEQMSSSIDSGSTNTVGNIVRVIATVSNPKDDTEIAYFELIPDSINDGVISFKGSFKTDDHVTTAGYFRVTEGMQTMLGLDEILVPMTAVVNLYVIYKYTIRDYAGNVIDVPTNNKFIQFNSYIPSTSNEASIVLSDADYNDWVLNGKITAVKISVVSQTLLNVAIGDYVRMTSNSIYVLCNRTDAGAKLVVDDYDIDALREKLKLSEVQRYYPDAYVGQLLLNTFQNYSWSNKYSTKNYPIIFIRPMNMIRSDLTFCDYTRIYTVGVAKITQVCESLPEAEVGNYVLYNEEEGTYSICSKTTEGSLMVVNDDGTRFTQGDIIISSVPVIGVDDIAEYLPLVQATNPDETEISNCNFSYFIRTYTAQYAHLENIVEYLLTSTHLDVKFYNTYGKSENFIIGDEVDGEEIIDTVNISIRYYIWVNANTDKVKAESDIKQFIKDYIEQINTDGTNSFYNSNLIRSLENNFSYIHHIKFIGINDYKDGNDYDTKYQSIKNVTVDLDVLTKEERIRYVPEILVANINNIHITLFDI